MKLTAELNINAIAVSEGEILILVLPENAFPPPYPGEDGYDEEVDPLMQEFVKAGLGDRVFILYADGVQMAKIKR